MALEWIIAHGDCDGICSAAISLFVNPEAKVFFSHPAGLLRDLANVREGDVLICDIAISRNYAKELGRELSRLAKSRKVIYIDHHPLPDVYTETIEGVKFIIGNDETSSSELVWGLFEKSLPLEMSRVMIYGAIADYSDGTPLVKKLLELWDKRELFLESGILIEALGGIRKRDYDFKRHVVQLLSKNLLPSSDDDILKTAIKERRIDEVKRKLVCTQTKVSGSVSHVLDIGWSLGKAATYARVCGGTPIGVAGETRDEVIDVSVRGLGNVDVGRLAEGVALELGGSGGGHRNAAGARIPAGTFESFVVKISSRLSEWRNFDDT